VFSSCLAWSGNDKRIGQNAWNSESSASRSVFGVQQNQTSHTHKHTHTHTHTDLTLAAYILYTLVPAANLNPKLAPWRCKERPTWPQTEKMQQSGSQKEKIKTHTHTHIPPPEKHRYKQSAAWKSDWGWAEDYQPLSTLRPSLSRRAAPGHRECVSSARRAQRAQRLGAGSATSSAPGKQIGTSRLPMRGDDASAASKTMPVYGRLIQQLYHSILNKETHKHGGSWSVLPPPSQFNVCHHRVNNVVSSSIQ